jgi:hypothetical protein
MRIAILSIFLIFIVQTMFAADLQPRPAEMTAHPPHRTRLPKEKKGTVAFISTLILGPVGYLGVYAFSQDDHVLCRARKGLAIWGKVVLLTGLIVLSAWAKTPIDFTSFNFGD